MLAAGQLRCVCGCAGAWPALRLRALLCLVFLFAVEAAGEEGHVWQGGVVSRGRALTAPHGAHPQEGPLLLPAWTSFIASSLGRGTHTHTCLPRPPSHTTQQSAAATTTTSTHHPYSHPPPAPRASSSVHAPSPAAFTQPQEHRRANDGRGRDARNRGACRQQAAAGPRRVSGGTTGCSAAGRAGKEGRGGMQAGSPPAHMLAPPPQPTKAPCSLTPTRGALTPTTLRAPKLLISHHLPPTQLQAAVRPRTPTPRGGGEMNPLASMPQSLKRLHHLLLGHLDGLPPPTGTMATPWTASGRQNRSTSSA